MTDKRSAMMHEADDVVTRKKRMKDLKSKEQGLK